jgi:hypothetical protein
MVIDPYTYAVPMAGEGAVNVQIVAAAAVGVAVAAREAASWGTGTEVPMVAVVEAVKLLAIDSATL